LDKATNDVTEINKKVDTFANELKDSQSAQDIMLDNIKANTETLPDSIKSHIDTVELKITNKLLELKNTADEVNNKAAQAIQKLDNIISAIAQATTISKSIQSDIVKLKESVDSEFAAMRSTINVNRWITIIGIIILIVLHFVK
jgi:CHASE3 domain sensor protein